MITFKGFIQNEGTTFDVYQKNKIEWLNDDKNNGYIANRTKITYYRTLESNVHNLEVAKGKDLNKFTSVEIENLIKSAITNSESTKRTIFAAINNYLIYCSERGIIGYNQCDSISKKGLFKVNAKALKSQYLPLDEFYNYIDSFTDVTDLEKIVPTLVRYGVPVSVISDVTIEDLDKENKELNIIIKEKYVTLNVDDEFIKRFDLALISRSKWSPSVNKLIVNKNGVLASTNFIYSIMQKFKDNGSKQIDTGILFKNRRYDLVLEIYKEENEVTQEDLKDILELLALPASPNRVFMLKNEIEEMFDIEVNILRMPYTSKPIDVIDVETGEVLGTFKSIKALGRECEEKLGMYIDKGAVSKIASGKSDRTTYKGLTFRYANEE